MQRRGNIPLPAVTRSLSARLLVLTVAFVMLGEILIYVPSISRFRLVYMQERIAASHEATLALEETPGGMVTDDLERKLLRHARVRSIALRTPGAAYLMLGEAQNIDAAFDLRDATPIQLIVDAFMALAAGGDRVLRVVGPARLDPRVLVDITLDEAPLRAEMLDYSGRILILSIVLSLLTASLVFLSLHWLMVRPMRKITESLVAFREAPEDVSSDVGVSDRKDEIGVAQHELAEMQRGLRASLRQRARLAALGSAMGKINHDLRNILATAVLVSDRLVNSDDPEVRRQTPVLMAAINRAVALCEDTLRFARPDAVAMRREPVHLAPLVDDVGQALGLFGEGDIRWSNRVGDDFVVHVDRDQFFRVLLNVGRNALEAVNGGGEIGISARHGDAGAVIEISDTGPGLPARAREHLFEPFSGSVRKGGTGLGLPIAREIARAHGGDIRLVRSDLDGTVFRIDLPQAERA